MRYVNHFVYRRPRLIISFAVGAVVASVFPLDTQIITRALIGWNIGVWFYLISMAWLVTRASYTKVKGVAEQEDESAIATLFILSIAAIISVAAIVFELSSAKSLPVETRLLNYAFTASTVLGSWLLVGTLYTVHYAHMFYRASSQERPFVFPNEEKKPDYWDFLYLSFTVAMTAQTSDVTVYSRSARKTVLAQSVLSFLFNVAIVGLSINIAAGIIGG